MKILCLANGPSAYVQVFKALKHEPDRIFGCNKSLKIWSECTDYVLTDPNNVKRFREDAELAQRRGVKLWMPPWAEKASGLKADCPFTYSLENRDDYSRENIAHGRSVGIVMLQLALRSNPSEVLMVGYDGYPPNWMSKHELTAGQRFTEIENYGREAWWNDCNETARQVIEKIITDRADVRFLWLTPQIIEPPKLANVSIL